MAIRYKLTKNRQSYPGNIYTLSYLKGKIVIAPHELGIFVCRRKKDAENYLQQSAINGGYTHKEILEVFEILKVETIGKGRKLTFCPSIDQFKKGFEKDDILHLSRKMNYAPLHYAGDFDIFSGIHVWMCTPGTMVYPGVKVLT